ncbi:MAG: hypothetical protein RQ824_03745 [bacterium]|nr:hypothetical protein [bacterium]
MKKILCGIILSMLPLAAMAAGVDENIMANDVNAIPKMTVETLKKKVEAGERVAIIDSRTGGSWDNSKVKIKGAIRIPYKDTATMAASKIPMGYAAVVYCT